MSQFTFKIKLPPYLAEWFVHEHGGEQPVRLIKGSAESNIVQAFVRQRPYDAKDPDDCNVAVFIPYFKSIDVRTYNYMPPAACEALQSCIYNNFKVDLYAELHKLENCRAEIGLLIKAYMEKHGISGVEGDTNWESVRQSYYRIRKRYNMTRARSSVKQCEIPFEKHTTSEG